MSNLEQDGFHPAVAASEYQKRALAIQASFEQDKAEMPIDDDYTLVSLVAKLSQLQFDVYAPLEGQRAFRDIDEALWKGKVTLESLGLLPEHWKRLCGDYRMHSNYMHYALPEIFGLKRDKHLLVNLKQLPECSVRIKITRCMNEKGIPAINIRTFLWIDGQFPRKFLDFSGEAIGLESRGIRDFLESLEHMAEIEMETLGKLRGIHDKN